MSWKACASGVMILLMLFSSSGIQGHEIDYSFYGNINATEDSNQFLINYYEYGTDNGQTTFTIHPHLYDIQRQRFVQYHSSSSNSIILEEPVPISSAEDITELNVDEYNGSFIIDWTYGNNTYRYTYNFTVTPGMNQGIDVNLEHGRIYLMIQYYNRSLGAISHMDLVILDTSGDILLNQLMEAETGSRMVELSYAEYAYIFKVIWSADAGERLGQRYYAVSNASLHLLSALDHHVKELVDPRQDLLLLLNQDELLVINYKTFTRRIMPLQAPPEQSSISVSGVATIGPLILLVVLAKLEKRR